MVQDRVKEITRQHIPVSGQVHISSHKQSNGV